VRLAEPIASATMKRIPVTCFLRSGQGAHKTCHPAILNARRIMRPSESEIQILFSLSPHSETNLGRRLSRNETVTLANRQNVDADSRTQGTSMKKVHKVANRRERRTMVAFSGPKGNSGESQVSRCCASVGPGADRNQRFSIGAGIPARPPCLASMWKGISHVATGISRNSYS
jgi:hypothetical protein